MLRVLSDITAFEHQQPQVSLQLSLGPSCRSQKRRRAFQYAARPQRAGEEAAGDDRPETGAFKEFSDSYFW